MSTPAAIQICVLAGNAIIGSDDEGYNLNISRYISIAISESEIDLAATHEELVEIENTVKRQRVNTRNS